ncbi:MAG: AIPR family protein [Deltaproteobacteria bacterium]|jgi:hypothetical protein|nr:AIPR family protein [Deltaproteobacteria bacterium]
MNGQTELNINAGIVDQRITGIVAEHSDWLPGGDENKKKSTAFVLLCMNALLEISLEEAADLLTEGGNDAGVDGLNIGDVDDGEFTVTIFQGKYKIANLSGSANFPENGVRTSLHTVTTLFDPAKQIEVNEKLAPKLEEIRSLVRDGYIPNVRVVLCNNGVKWNDQSQAWIDQSGLPPDQVAWLHFNHDNIVEILRKTKSVDDSLNFTGQAVIEDFNFRRVLIGKVRVSEIAELFNRHNDFLLERNIRRYLGLNSNRVNVAMHETLLNEQKRSNFYFFNNGITIICRKFRHNALQGANYQVRLENMQVINGGQTCKTIQQTLNDLPDGAWNETCVLVRIYELADEDQDFVKDITYATNSQNPVDLRDLRSNDEMQRQLEIGMKDLGYTYKRQREEGGSGSAVIASSIVAEAVLAIWRKKPHQAKFLRREHFGKLYNEIFSGLNAAQAIMAVLIFRAVENERKRPVKQDPPDFLPYSSHYLAMIIGERMLALHNIGLDGISHKNVAELIVSFEEKQNQRHSEAVNTLQKALSGLYGKKKLSFQQLSATFRRGDLLDYITAPV